MSFSKISLFTILIFLFATPVSAQIKLGNKLDRLTRTVENKVQRSLDKKARNMQEEQLQKDTASYNYAISITDNASFFDSGEDQQSFLLGAMKATNTVNMDLSRAETVFDYNRTGNKLYGFNKFRLAEIKFMSALALFIEGNYDRYQQQKGLEAQLVDAYLAKLMVNFNFEKNLDMRGFSELDMHAYTQTLSNIGILNHTKGRYTMANRFGYQALKLREAYFGEVHPATATSLNNMAVLYKDQGKFNEAEEMQERALRTQEAIYGKESMEYVIFLNNKALLYQATGRLEEADQLLSSAIQTAAGLVDDQSRDFTKLMINSALLKHEMGQYQEAEKSYLTLLDLKKKRFGARHPEYAHLLNSLASLYIDMGRESQAKELLDEALQIFQAKFGKTHPSYASTLSNLGHWYRLQGQVAEAQSTFEEVKRLREAVLGENHPDLLATEEDLCLVYWESGQTDKAVAGFDAVIESYLDLVAHYFPPMSEHEKTKFWEKIRPKLMIFNSFAVANSNTHPSLLEKMYNLHLATKGMLLNATTRIREQILNGTDQTLKQAYLDWLDQREQLAVYYTYTQEQLQQERVNLDSLESLANTAEKQLSGKMGAFADVYAKQAPTMKQVQAKLSANAAAIELIRFKKFDRRFTESIAYAALVIDASKTTPSLVLLDNGDELEDKFFQYYKIAIGRQIEDDYTFEQYWKPIEALLKGKKTVYLSADGVYNQINVNTFLRPDNTYILDHHDIILVSSTRQLVEGFAQKGQSQKQQATLMGFPDYGTGGKIESLPGTKVEIEQLQKILASHKMGTDAYLEEHATEANLKNVTSTRILHIATHGYFLEDLAAATGGKVFGVEVEKARENPLLRSGLMLTNAEDVFKELDYRQINQENNGILTAFEAMNLQLAETDLVVLSACETGLGEVKAGEGVYGLQRAFQVAGASSIIMSLWKVSDEATQELMTTFYEKWLTLNDKQKAFHQAQVILRKKHPEPYYWGAFILLN